MASIGEVYEKNKEALLPQCMSMLGPKISGKTTIGTLMAARTNMKLVDFNFFIKASGLVGQSDEDITQQFI
jgi:shikimate kinase